MQCHTFGIDNKRNTDKVYMNVLTTTTGTLHFQILKLPCIIIVAERKQ